MSIEVNNKSCKICGTDTELFHDNQFAIYYFHCTNCEFIFIDESKIVSPEEEKANYDNHNNNLENEGYVNMFKDFIKGNIEPYKNQIETALDFGCGPGPVLAILLKKMGFEVDIYDIYFAPERVYENKSYDLITATEVFEHLEDPLSTSKFLKQHLNQGGLLAIMTLFHPGNEQDFSNWWYRRDPTHISFFQPKTFKIMADILDMEVVKNDNKNTLVMRKK